MNSAIILLGSNIDPENNITAALRVLRQDLQVISVSGPLKTPTVIKSGQHGITTGFFINAAAKIDWPYQKSQLITRLKQYETALGRATAQKGWQDRVIDFDLVGWNGKLTDTCFNKYRWFQTLINQLS